MRHTCGGLSGALFLLRTLRCCDEYEIPAEMLSRRIRLLRVELVAISSPRTTSYAWRYLQIAKKTHAWSTEALEIVCELTVSSRDLAERSIRRDRARSHRDRGWVLMLCRAQRAFSLRSGYSAMHRICPEATKWRRAVPGRVRLDGGHAGPGTPHVPGPYPRFLTNPVFFLICAADLDPTKIVKHRADNGLRGRFSLTIDLQSCSDSRGPLLRG